MKYLVLFLGAILSLSVYATLGKDPSSVPQDSQLSSTSLYSVYETQASDYKLYQYVNLPVRNVNKSNNIIYAVIWKGVSPPNLKDVLGEQNFKIFTTNKPVISTLNYKKYVTKDLVVEISGHQGDIFGSAYIPSKMPKNITIEGLIKNAK